VVHRGILTQSSTLNDAQGYFFDSRTIRDIRIDRNGIAFSRPVRAVSPPLHHVISTDVAANQTVIAQMEPDTKVTINPGIQAKDIVVGLLPITNGQARNSIKLRLHTKPKFVPNAFLDQPS